MQPANSANGKLSIYDYATFGDYLGRFVSHKRKHQSGFSYGVLARQLGLKYPSQLTMVARGERIPSHNLVLQLCEKFKLTANEKKYAILLVNMHRAKSVVEKQHFAEQIKSLKPANPAVLMDIDTLDLISNWYNLVVLEMVELEDFKFDAEWVAKRMDNAISKAVAQESLDLLVRLDLINFDDTGKARKLAPDLSTPRFSTSDGIRAFYKTMLEFSIKHLQSKPVEERYFAGTTLAINTKKLDQAKQMVAEFRDHFQKEMGASPGDEVYYLAFQLLPTTKKLENKCKNLC